MFDLDQWYNWSYNLLIIPLIHIKPVHSLIPMGDLANIQSHSVNGALLSPGFFWSRWSGRGRGRFRGSGGPQEYCECRYLYTYVTPHI